MKEPRKNQLKPQTLAWLNFGETSPAGWMRAQMLRDLEHGFLGHLDELVPSLIKEDDIYGENRLTAAARSKDLGVLAVEKEWEVQFLWWNSETQSNWRDGLLRSALLLDDGEVPDPAHLPRLHAYIDHILSTQDADGYIGIYASDLRYSFNTENGELWAQAALFRVLLGWYEAYGEAHILQALRRAVGTTIRAYPIHHSHPFRVTKDYAGVCHGLMFTDVLDRLYQLTGEQEYLDYALWLYQEYSASPLSVADMQLDNLLNPARHFHAHGVHTYEHLRSLLTAVYASEDPRLESALLAALEKLELCLTPSGAPIGDENIGGRAADASETGYEYCSIHELLDTYTHLLQKTGQPRWADRVEWLLFNAAQGARHPDGQGIAYLKTDNSFSMTGTLHPNDPQNPDNPQTRYKYSPAHQDVAVCCVPNAGRIFPYYVKAMWMRTPDGLLAALYCASELRTQVNGVQVSIRQETRYPFELEMAFFIETAKPAAFELAFRKPEWATGFHISTGGEWREENGLIKIHKIWQGRESLRLRFEAEIQTRPFGKDEFYLSCGPLLFALPLDGQVKEGRRYPLQGFRDLYYTPAQPLAADWRLAPSQVFKLEPGGANPETPWQRPPVLVGSLYNTAQGLFVPVRLVPCGSTILRQVTFRHPD